MSDLHFGAVDERTVEPLLEAIADLSPDLVVISGDLTQRARRDQFLLARDFIRRLPGRGVIAVPGNHDVPLWDLARRALAPCRRFYGYLGAERFPAYRDDEIVAVGVNTARPSAIKNGRINREQLQRIEEILDEGPAGALRVVIAHHPFVIPEGEPLKERVGRADVAIPAFLRVGVDLLLTGHRHHSWMSVPSSGLLAIHAGTATSHRVRREANAFNEIRIEADRITVRRFVWQPAAEAFQAPQPESTRSFRRHGGILGVEEPLEAE